LKLKNTLSPHLLSAFQEKSHCPRSAQSWGRWAKLMGIVGWNLEANKGGQILKLWNRPRPNRALAEAAHQKLWGSNGIGF